MARNHQVLKQTIRLFSPKGVEGLSGRSSDQELDESDIFYCQPESRKLPTVHPKPTNYKKPEASPPSMSMPINVPDWSKILLHEHKSTSRTVNSYKDEIVDDDDDDDEEITRLPPHEIVMRRRTASLSVVEGFGRTLKGRDLSRVRDAIWAQTGFQD